jgi:hypothetical protein
MIKSMNKDLGGRRTATMGYGMLRNAARCETDRQRYPSFVRLGITEDVFP